MGEKIKKPYDWKGEYQHERDSNKKWRTFGKTVIATGLIAGGLSLTNSDNRAEALKYANDLIHPQTKNEISIENNQNIIASDIITVKKDENLAYEVTQSVERMASANNIDRDSIPYQEIQAESRQAQDGNNIQHISYPGDQYETKIAKLQSGGYNVSVKPYNNEQR
jgi:hypothetical protein